MVDPVDDNAPYVMIAADSHAGLPTAEYRPYLEKKFHADFDEFLAGRDAVLAEITAMGVRNEAFAKQWFEQHERELAGGWDGDRRNEALDGDGVVAEVVYPDADAVESRTCVPFGAGLGMAGDLDPALGMAGSIAHNRWLAELCAHTPERRCGVALVPITAEMDDVLAEIRRAKESGLGAVMIPARWVDQLPYQDRHYDPVWALCEELEMPIVTHSGGVPREEFGGHLGIFVTEVTWWPARPLWFLLWSGVFERYPRLKFGVTESGCWWLPQLLWSWDRLFIGHQGSSKLSTDAFPLTMLPSEYMDRNCFCGLAGIKRRELGFRYEIGVDNMLWGTDFPHPEGTWPNTRAWLQKTFYDVPIDETRRMLGLAAADTFGFDVDRLQPLADKIGPTPTDLGQLGEGRTAADLEARWAPTKEVGRHWLTDHDFSMIAYDRLAPLPGGGA